MHISSVNVSMLVHDASNLSSGPGYVFRALLSPRGDLALPEFALIVAIERQRGGNLFQGFWPLASPHQNRGRNQNEVARRMNDGFEINPLKIRISLQAVPESNSFADGFIPTCALNPIMADFALHHSSVFSELVVAPNSHK